tara:strand:+ start:4932 stop:5783 length:852 start_codon:yes stop_codon:yes gene_type:complete
MRIRRNKLEKTKVEDYKANPAPNEVLHDPNFLFDEPTHVYSLKDQPELKLTSATTFIHNYFAPFDREKIASKLIQNVPKYQGCTKEDLFKDWEQSGISGTNVHNSLEHFILEYSENGSADYENSLQKCCVTDIERKKARHGMDWLGDNIFGKDHLKLYPEVRVVTRDWKIAGMIDLLVHDTKKDEYTILDWKTNKRISKKSYGGTVGSRECTADLEDCNFTHYTLQLSLYRYILEREYGLKVNKHALIHVSEDKATVHETEYLLSHIVAMFADAVKRGEIKWT